ncbi:hypothetical protein [Kitasatospora aureofaciens]|uniref:hypothetical protein n=1 Tax=Kitasatospora aureofaciens TaxID=1894 RepID=UPI00131B375E|nr:hypothetical protein [Kitasatospora aureofaciens]
MESDARGIEGDDSAGGGARCGWFGAPIRSTGPGQRPGYCKGRSCSSKAARRRAKQRQEAALAAVMDGSRESSSLLGTETARLLARQGGIVERTAHRLAADLDRGRTPCDCG